MKANLTGKVALVMGSTAGIGRAIALTLAENGADLVINSMVPDQSQEIIKQIESLGPRAIFEQANMLDYSEVKKMVDSAIQRLGGIDILVASGGLTLPGQITQSQSMVRLFHETPPEQYIQYASYIWFSRLYPIKAVLDHMIQKQSGKIVIITTDAGRSPTVGESFVGGAAAAVVLMTKVMAKEFARWKIRINTICTTVTRDTPSYKDALAGEMGAIFKKAEARMPFGINKPADLAQAALFFASEESNQITGQILTISGGLSFPG